jgi:arylsulfatase A-like enzyme
LKAIVLLFDSLNRHMLSPYGCEWTHTPNFERLRAHTVRFDRSFIGSMPCIPARRELHTGRHNFLHRSWGPLEPFDDSAIELLSEAGVYTHLITDHQHYWEDGGATFHNRYRSYEFVRGQEGDKWKGQVVAQDLPEHLAYQKKILYHADRVNRKYMQREEDHPQAKVFNNTFEFLDANRDADNWLLHVECFDPHEPFMSTERQHALYPDLRSEGNDWPDYGSVHEEAPEKENIRLKYAALLSMCDENLGRLLDYMDDHDLWKDTMLIVNTDHGFLLSEHDYWGKMVMPFYNEVALTPLFIWDPRYKAQDVARNSIVQLIDLPPTLLRFFNQPIPRDMQGQALDGVIASDEPVRDAALFGMFGGPVNCTDGRYVYMRGVRAKDNKPLFQYTLMPTHMRRRFTVAELSTAVPAAPFSFTKGLQTLRVEAGVWDEREPFSFSGMVTPDSMREDLLFDIEDDPSQLRPIVDPAIERRMIALMKRLMEENDAPDEQFERMGLAGDKKRDSA